MVALMRQLRLLTEGSEVLPLAVQELAASIVTALGPRGKRAAIAINDA